MSLRALLLGLVLCVLIGTGAWLWSSSSPQAETRQGALGVPSAPLKVPDLAQATEAQARDATRQESAANEYLAAGRVLDEGGRPIPEARVVWVLHVLEDTEETPPFPGGGWGSLERPSVVTSTDAAGRFEFERAPAVEMPYGSVLIASHAGFVPVGTELGKLDDRMGIEVVLRAGREFEVFVRDEGGAAVYGALVKRVGAANYRGSPSEHEQFVQDTALTDSDGRVAMTSLMGEQAIWAEKGELISEPWQGVHPESIELRLASSFTIGGTVTTDRTNWGDYQGERRIVVSERRGNLWVPLVRVRGIQRAFGPLRVPLGVGDLYEVRLEGIPIAPQSARFVPPPPGTHHEFAFEVKKEACQLLFEVKGPDGEILPAAQVVAWWGQETPDEGPNVVRGSPMPDGTTYVGTFPEGRIFYEVSAPGFASFNQSTTVPLENGIAITLLPGGRVTGHVRSGGEPVRDFQIVCWKEGAARENRSAFQLGRKDGEFEIDGLGAGEWRIQAASPDYPPSPIVVARVDVGVEVGVELDLVAALPGGGRVIDRSTGVPIEGAELQVLGSGGMEAGLPWRPPFRAGPDGTFEIDAFSLGSNYLCVRAPGYAELVAKKSCDGPFVDWGDIRLARPQTLEIRLAGFEAAARDPTSFHATSVGRYELPYTAFDPDGRVRFEDVPPCDLLLKIYESQSAWARLQLRLEADKVWSFEHRVAGGRRLEIVLVDGAGQPERLNHGVYVSTVESSGITTLRSQALADGAYSFAGITADTAQVWVIDDGKTVASADVSFGGESTLRREISLRTDDLRMRVLDGEGNPLTGAWVTIRAPEAAMIFVADDTDSAGWAELAGVPHERLLADVHHGIAGWRFGVPVDASLREQDFVLAATGSITLRVTDGAEPLADVTTRIETPGGHAQTRPRATGADGSVRYEPLGEGQYRIVCRRSDCWTTVADIALAPGTHATPTVAMRRLAELELLVRSAEGTPLSGVEVTLRSLEFGASVQDWLAASLVEGSLRTTQDGTLELRGLPSGPYAWSLTTPAAAGGTLELAPGANALDVGRGP